MCRQKISKQIVLYASLCIHCLNYYANKLTFNLETASFASFSTGWLLISGKAELQDLFSVSWMDANSASKVFSSGSQVNSNRETLLYYKHKSLLFNIPG